MTKRLKLKGLGPTHIPCDPTLAQSSTEQCWINMALIPTVFLPGTVQSARLNGQKALQTVIISKSAA